MKRNHPAPIIYWQPLFYLSSPSFSLRSFSLPRSSSSRKVSRLGNTTAAPITRIHYLLFLFLPFLILFQLLLFSVPQRESIATLWSELCALRNTVNTPSLAFRGVPDKKLNANLSYSILYLGYAFISLLILWNIQQPNSTIIEIIFIGMI